MSASWSAARNVASRVASTSPTISAACCALVTDSNTERLSGMSASARLSARFARSSLRAMATAASFVSTPACACRSASASRAASDICAFGFFPFARDSTSSTCSSSRSSFNPSAARVKLRFARGSSGAARNARCIAQALSSPAASARRSGSIAAAPSAWTPCASFACTRAASLSAWRIAPTSSDARAPCVRLSMSVRNVASAFV